jgi:tripartite ATP-independent transporter DctM subunit
VSAGLEVGIVLVVFFGLLAIGYDIAFAIAVPAILYIVFISGFEGLRSLGLVTWGSLDSFTLTAIPLFILMATVLRRSGLSLRVYRGLARLVRMLPGGLLLTNIAGCAMFAAVSGSSVTTAAAIGGVALPELLKRNYDRRLSAGSLAAGGTLGILFPPSIALIVYGTFTQTSITQLFMAGVLPGMLLSLAFMLYIAIHATLRPHIAPRDTEPLTPAAIRESVVDLLPFVVLIVILMGSLYAGIATPTEAAAVGSIFGILISAIWGDLTWSEFRLAMRESLDITGSVLFIVFTAFVFSYAVGVAGLGEVVTGFLVGLHLNYPEFFAALIVLYTILGFLLESLGMIVVTVPLLYPVLLKYGLDPIWFGVVLVMFVELGQITPPLGINLFVIQGIWKGKIEEVVLGTIPFHVIMFAFVILLGIFPELALWLPQHTR